MGWTVVELAAALVYLINFSGILGWSMITGVRANHAFQFEIFSNLITIQERTDSGVYADELCLIRGWTYTMVQRYTVWVKIAFSF